MYYAESQPIRDKILNSKKILINVHRHPDADSVCSALAMYRLAVKWGKQAELICPDVPGNIFHFAPDAGLIRTIDYEQFDFSPYNLFIICDTGGWEMVSGNRDGRIPDIEKVVIDHHATNRLEAAVRLVDIKAAATAEIIYKLMKDWTEPIDKQSADLLLAGIISDSMLFKYTGGSSEVFRITGDLLDKGADKDYIIENLFHRMSLEEVKLTGLFLEKLKIDPAGFSWTAVNFEDFVRLGKPRGSKDLISGMFIRSIGGVNFGLVILEEKKNELSVSWRSGNGVNVASMALEFGGGGHIRAAGCTVRGAFEETVERILAVARRFSGQKNENHR